jgi:hypothetical protein
MPGGGLERFWIRNVTDSIFEFRIERVKILQADGAQDFLVFGETEDIATAYSPGVVSANDPFITLESHPLGGPNFGYLGSHYLKNESSGCSQFRYYVLNESDERLDSVDVRFCSTLSTPENAAVELSIFPNPSTDIVQFQLNDVNKMAYEMTITDLCGKVVYYGLEVPKEISLSDFDTGIYMVLLKDPKTNEVVFNKKLVKK